ncbi:MAG: UbiA family prenyltransferase [Tepidisphaeraceae bacterium]
MKATPDQPRGLARWWTYQRERFPLLGHGPLVLAFSSCAVVYSAQLRGATSLPGWPAFVVAFVTCFVLFLQLRIADEFKDYDEDLKYRPYRPVQRGLVTLKELAVVFAIGACIQFALALWHDARLVLWLGVVWTYLILMSREFFVHAWLKAHPVVYLLSHMVILPLVDFYATATDWITHGRAPAGLLWFVLASYCNGVVIEIGRRIRVPADEETGVQTYSSLWGRTRASVVWLAAIAGTLAFATTAARATGHVWLVGAGLLVAAMGAGIVVAWFLRQTRSGSGKRIELASALWTLWLYLLLGWITWLTR